MNQTKTLPLKDVFGARVAAFFSDRSIDFVLKPDQKDLTPAQKEYLSQQTGLPVSKIVNIRQVHGEHIVAVTAEDLNANTPIPEADGVITNSCQVPIAVRTADCLPVFIFDPKKNCLGLVHAGWRGSEKRIVVKALKLMRDYWGCAPENVQIMLGPAIRACCYQVGEEFKEFFPGEVFLREEKLFLDLALVNRNQLLKYGVRTKNIFDAEACTCCDPSLFSYRREGQSAGRHLSLMILRSN